MKKHCRWLLFFASLAFPAIDIADVSAQSVIQPISPNILGHYSCEGYDAFYDMKYKGPLLIKKVGNNYEFNWNFGEAGGRFSGVALYNAKERVLAVMFLNPEDVTETGVGIYAINENGSLSGNWMYQYKDQISNELCTPMNKETA